jgi:hypothetical protein
VDEEVVPIHISQMEYIWAGKPGRAHPEIVEWYNEFEELLRCKAFNNIPQANTQYSRRMQGNLWLSVKKVYHDMVAEADGRCIIEGMRDPMRMIRSPSGNFLPRQGNQRLCVLRACNYHWEECKCHHGMVPSVILPR